MQKSYSTLSKGSHGRSESVKNGLDQSEALKRHLSLCLRTCAAKKCLISSMLTHDETIRAGQDKDVYLSSLIFDLYGKCGALYDAHAWFTWMQERSAFSWNCLISLYVRRMHSVEALQCFEQMQQECIIPNSATFGNVMAACAHKDFLVQGIRLHARSQYAEFEALVVVQTALISMYNKCSKYQNAQLVFEVMVEKDTVAWNAMLSAFVAQGDSVSAIQLFSQMQMECVMHDKYTYATMFSACSSMEALRAGKQLHACILHGGFAINNVIILALVNMYNKCGSVSNAREVFYESSKQDMIIWNAVITGLANESNGREVIQLFDNLLEEALMPDKVTFLSAFAECASQAAVWQGAQFHLRLLATQLRSDVQLETALVHMYGKLGRTTDASLVFNNMLEHDTVSWNAMISILSQHGLISAAFQNFKQMQEEGSLPNEVTFTSVLSGCVDSTTLPLGKHLHALLLSTEVITDVFTGNALIKMYSKCGKLNDAHKVFSTMASRDTISWNSMIAGYAQNGNTGAALFLLNQMCAQEIIPDQATYCSVLSVLASDVPHGEIFEGDNTSTWTMGDMKSGIGITENLEVFKKGKQEHGDNEGWSRCSIVGSTVSGHVAEESNVLIQSKTEHVAFRDYIRKKLIAGMLLHCHILLNGLDIDVVVQKAMLRFYGKCGSLKDCRSIFAKVSTEDVVAWNLMIAACILQGHDKEAIQLFDQMQREGTVLDNISFLNVINACSNIASLFHGRDLHMQLTIYGFDSEMTVGTALVTLYAKCGSLAEARWLFDQLLERDVVAWTSMISTYVQFGNSEEALELFKQMQSEGVMPDVVSFTSALNASEAQSALFEGKLIYACLTQYHLESHIDVVIALVYMYGKCGSLTDAKSVFSRVLEPCVSLWNGLIASYAQHGDGQKVFPLFFSMLQQGIIPNSVTFLSILCACSRAGLVEEAYACLLIAFQENDLLPGVEHYDCMVDLLGRVGQLDEAEDLLKLMPFIPTIVSWASFLATFHQVNTKRAEVATSHLIELNPVDPATYVTLANIYATLEESDDTGKFDQQENGLCAMLTPSWT